MLEFDKIHVIWRKGAGSDRHSIGVLKKDSDGKHTFAYDSSAAELQQKEGFYPYTEFQDFNKVYNGNVAEIFGQRLMKTDRPDIETFFIFWEVDKEKSGDKFYLLGKTQGLVPTDNFEFLAEYNLIPGLKFLTEITGLSQANISPDSIKVDDELNYKLEPDNTYDRYAVKVFKDDLYLGHIKKYHSMIFHKEPTRKLKLTVKAIDKNGKLKRVFVKVEVA